jgi:hypothetical protein
MLARSLCTALVLVAACGKPVDPSGKVDTSFTRAAMGVPSTDPNRPLAADLAVEPVSMLVMFNRLHTGDKLTEALNRKPGQFSRVDLDKNSVPDPLTAVVNDASDGHAVEIRAKPPTGEYVVATLMFDPEWEFMGHYGGLKGGAASTISQPLLAAGAPAPVMMPPTTTPVPVATTPTPVATAPAPAPAAPSPTPAAGSVQAVPAGSNAAAGIAAP